MDTFPSFRGVDAEHVARRLDDPRFICDTADYGRMLVVAMDTGTARQGVEFWLENPNAMARALSFASRTDFLDWFADTARDKLLAWEQTLTLPTPD